MKGKTWVFIIGAFVTVGLIVVGLVLVSGILDVSEVEAGVSDGASEMAQSATTVEDQPADQGGGQPLWRTPDQQAEQDGNPPAHATNLPQNPGATPPPQNIGQGLCSNQFELDGASSISAGQQFDAGESFQVDWPIQNTGTCTWTSDYSLNFVNGNQMGATSPIALTSTVAPGDSVTVSVQMTAPSQPDMYTSFWKLQDENGQVFGMNGPQDAPLRVKIEVVQSGNNPSNPAVTAVPEIAVTLPNTLNNGVGETMLMDQCFDLVEGDEVSCGDPDADIKYTYSSVIGGYLRGVNGSLFSNSHESAPGESTCEGESFYGMPVLLGSGGKYLCIETDYDGDTVFGWVNPTSHNSGGLTFNYLLWVPNTTLQVGEAMPLADLFTLASGDQETLLMDKCYDFVDGKKSACNGSDADIKYIKSGSDYMIETLNNTELAFAIYYDNDAPSKANCEAYDTYLSGYHYLNQQPDHYACFRMDYGGDTVYGWFRVTAFNSGGMTFDYQVWNP